MPDQDVAGLGPALPRQQSAQLPLHPLGLPGLRPAETPGDAADMGIDGHPRNSKRIAKNHVGGFAPNHGKWEEVIHGIGELKT